MSKETPPRRLGRGLDSLVSPASFRAASPDQPTPTSHRALPPEYSSPSTGQVFMKVDQLRPNKQQPRGQIRPEDIKSLTDSIKQSGVLQPVIVRESTDGFEIIAGERRWRAAKAAGLGEIPVVLRKATEEQMIEWAMVENLQREDLDPIERAKGYEHFCKQFRLTSEVVAERLGEDRSTVVNYLRLLELPETIQGLVALGRVSMGHARCLVSVSDELQQLRYAEMVSKKELSVRTLEDMVRRDKKSSPHRKSGPSSTPARTLPHIFDLERRFEDKLKTKVSIKEGKKKGSGRLTIEYFSLDDFDRIALRLGVSLEE
ncbi:MAG: ParB/RepB/Spo0J family partition protein [Planctomycetota bacterium]